ncbi:MAG TPA: hypothetical protein VD887_07980 [Allosphingosinicella sp.]|nr:hypothetical protein [Allosphingosinicella sp.]
MGVGLALLLVGCFALLIMHVAQSVPFRWWWQPSTRHEDPEAYRRYRLAYAAIAALGALAVAGSLLF